MGDSKRTRLPVVADRKYQKKKEILASQSRSSNHIGAHKKSVKEHSTQSNRLSQGLKFVMRLVGRLFWIFFWRVGVIVSLLIVLGVGVQFMQMSDFSNLLDGRQRGSVTLLDQTGKPFAWRGEQFGGVITDETVSPHLKNAILATEDKRFYRHLGVSFRGIIGAIWINLREGRGPLSGHGGSTITQQTAKLLCLGEVYDPSTGLTEVQFESRCRKVSIWRKIEEAVFAVAMELKFSKSEILTIYLNRVFLGAGTSGFQAASQRYFGLSVAEVNPAQAAMLAGLLVAPTRFAPTNNLQRSQNRAATILRLMNDQGYLDDDQYQYARNNPAELSAAAAAQAGGYFADWVMASGPDYFTLNTTEDVFIQTTFDKRLQVAAETAMIEVFDAKVREGSKAQAAIVVMSADGAVRAIVGGRLTRISGTFNRATQALRQTGSSFKPFVYATALNHGYSPLDTVLDQKFCMAIVGSGKWCPKNYKNKYFGNVTLAFAFRESLNIPAIKISEDIGRDKVRNVAKGFGLFRDLASGPSLALGVSESTLIEMTGAYAGILNGGIMVKPYGLIELRLFGDAKPVMGHEGRIGQRVISKRASEQLIWMMEKVISEGTGQRAIQPDGRPVAGKTGTTQAARDAWFIGFSADYVVGVWMGYDDNTPLTGVTGGGLPAEIWKETMIRVHDGLPIRALPMAGPHGGSQAGDGHSQQSSNGFWDNLVGDFLRSDEENSHSSSSSESR
ncbi:MAG: transglycosylase domain-containing protein [Aestuariivita sp.]|nr:transglycosylase domain-containing protein [Aestuariivita sp.]